MMNSIQTVGSIDFEQVGRTAFLNDEMAAPMLNTTVMDAVRHLAVGQGSAEIFRAFLKGWHAESMAAAFRAIED